MGQKLWLQVLIFVVVNGLDPSQFVLHGNHNSTSQEQLLLRREKHRGRLSLQI